MTAITFDTLKFANTLKEAGVPPAQAEAEAKALSEVLEINLKDLATKEDLARMEERFDAKLIQLEQRMVIKLGALMVIAVGVVAALVKML